MLKLRDFIHLEQVDTLVKQLVMDEPGLILLAGIEARLAVSQNAEAFTPSGLSALFNILMQEILLAHPELQAVVISQERSLARVPRQFNRRVRPLLVESPHTYTEQIDIAAFQRPGLIVIDQLTTENAQAAFRAAQNGLRVLAQMDTVVRGTAVARLLIDFGISLKQLSALRWVLTNQRMAALCSHCKQPLKPEPAQFERLCARYPHLRHVIESWVNAVEPVHFHQAVGCEHCHGTGYQGDLAIFDLFRNDRQKSEFFSQKSLLSLEEYALRLAAQGQLDLYDLLNLEEDHLRRTYHLLTSSERALTESNTALNRKLLELEASNRVLIQRTEALMTLQDLGQAFISSTSLNELAERISRRAGELCGADRVALYLHRAVSGGSDRAEVLAVRGWSSSLVGQQLDPDEVFAPGGEGKMSRYNQPPPGFKMELENNKPEGRK